MELDDADFGGMSQGAGKQVRGTDQDPAIVGVNLAADGHPLHVFLKAVPNLKNETIAEVLNRRVEPLGVWRTGYAAAAAKTHHADNEIAYRGDLEAAHVFRWVNTAMSNAKAMIDGTFHGRGRARLLMACLTTLPHPYGT